MKAWCTAAAEMPHFSPLQEALHPLQEEEGPAGVGLLQELDQAQAPPHPRCLLTPLAPDPALFAHTKAVNPAEKAHLGWQQLTNLPLVCITTSRLGTTPGAKPASQLWCSPELLRATVEGSLLTVHCSKHSPPTGQLCISLRNLA